MLWRKAGGGLGRSAKRVYLHHARHSQSLRTKSVSALKNLSHSLPSQSSSSSPLLRSTFVSARVLSPLLTLSSSPAAISCSSTFSTEAAAPSQPEDDDPPDDPPDSRLTANNGPLVFSMSESNSSSYKFVEVDPQTKKEIKWSDFNRAAVIRHNLANSHEVADALGKLIQQYGLIHEEKDGSAIASVKQKQDELLTTKSSRPVSFLLSKISNITNFIQTRSFRSMNFVRSVLDQDDEMERKHDVVHMNVDHNNTFVTVTDAKGNKKLGASVGCLEELKAGSRRSKYAVEAVAQHVGRASQNLGLKSVVMKVKGSVHFGWKKAAIIAWREGFTSGDARPKEESNVILSLMDMTNLPHNGCRLRKKKRK